MSLALHKSPNAGGNGLAPIKKPSLTPEDYASMQVYYKHSYKHNLRQRLLENLQEENEGSQQSRSGSRNISKNNQRQTGLHADSSKQDQQATKPFTKDMPIRAPSRSPKQMNINLNPYSGNRNMATSEIAKAAATALDKRCPRMELPDLYCFHADFRAPVESPDILAERAQQDEIDRRNRSTVGRVRKMYQVAIANSAATSRIAAKAELASGLSPLSFNPYTIGELVSINPEDDKPEQAAKAKRRSQSYRTFLDSANDEALLSYETDLAETAVEQDQTPPRRSVRPVFTPIQEEAEIDSHRTRATIGPRSDRGETVEEDDNDAAAATLDTAAQTAGVVRPPPLPLDLGETAQRSKTMEAKVMSQYWSNYLKAGQSKFARVGQQPPA